MGCLRPTLLASACKTSLGLKTKHLDKHLEEWRSSSSPTCRFLPAAWPADSVRAPRAAPFLVAQALMLCILLPPSSISIECAKKNIYSISTIEHELIAELFEQYEKHEVQVTLDGKIPED